MPNKDLEMQKELKRIRQEELKNELKAYKLKISEDRHYAMEDDKAKLENEGVLQRDEKTGKPIKTLWTQVEEQVDSVLSVKRAAYNDWQNAMTEVLAVMCDLSKAMIQTRKEWITGPLSQALVYGVQITDPLFTQTIPKFFGLPAQKAIPIPGSLDIYDLISGFVKDKFEKFTGKPDVDLPSLEHSVGFNDKNELTVEPLLRSDKVISAENKLDALFKKGVVDWLDQIGYAPKPGTNNEFMDKNDGTPLTKEMFETKKNDVNQGLNAYLSDRFDLNFVPRPTGP